MKKQGIYYLYSVWNWFDIGFFVFFISACICDGYTYWEVTDDVGRLLRPKGSGGGSDNDGGEEVDGEFEIILESGYKQATRILYAWLIIFGFFKLMA